MLAGSQNGRRVVVGAAITWKLALWGQTVTFKTGQIGREVHIFWMKIYIWWVVLRSNCMMKQRENLTLHLRWSWNRTTQCLLKLNSSHYFAASTKVLFGPQYNSPGIAVTTRSLSSSVFITLWKPQSASTNSIFIRMIRSLFERLKIKIKAVTICVSCIQTSEFTQLLYFSPDGVTVKRWQMSSSHHHRILKRGA